MGIVVLSFLVTAVVVFLIVFLLFRNNRSNKNPASSLLYWLTAIIATPIVYIGFLFAWFFVSSSFETQAFNKEKWSENRDIRYVYVDDLIDNQKLIGLTKIELNSMLGKADYEDDSTMQFYIGYSPKVFLNSDPDWLTTDLVNGKVSNTYVLE